MVERIFIVAFFALVGYFAYIQTDHVSGLLLAFIALGAFGLLLIGDK